MVARPGAGNGIPTLRRGHVRRRTPLPFSGTGVIGLAAGALGVGALTFTTWTAQAAVAALGTPRALGTSATSDRCGAARRCRTAVKATQTVPAAESDAAEVAPAAERDAAVSVESKAMEPATKASGEVVVKKIPRKDWKPAPKESLRRYFIDPKMKLISGVSEYRAVVEILRMLQDEDLLEGFYSALVDYYKEVNLLDVIRQKQSGNTKYTTKAMRRAWPRIWPKKLEKQRAEAFDKFAALWARIETSSLVDQLLQDISPSLKKGSKTTTTEQIEFMEMSEAVRERKIISRMQKHTLVEQFGRLTADDEDIQALADETAPFLEKLAAMTDNKAATMNEYVLPSLATILFVSFLAICFILFINLTFHIPLPFIQEELPVPPDSESIYKVSAGFDDEDRKIVSAAQQGLELS